MERYPTFLHKKNQCCENDYTTKCNLQIQCDPYEFTNDIFHRTRTKNFTIHMETHKTLNSQSSIEKEEWSWRNQPSWLQIILQSYSMVYYRVYYQDSMVLVQKQKYRPMEKDKYGTGTEDSMVLAQKQKYRLVEQERNPREKNKNKNKNMHLWVPYFWQRRQEYTIGQRQPLQ